MRKIYKTCFWMMTLFLLSLDTLVNTEIVKLFIPDNSMSRYTVQQISHDIDRGSLAIGLRASKEHQQDRGGRKTLM